MRKILAATMMLLLAPAVRGEGGAPAPVVAPDPPDDLYVNELNAMLPSQVEAKKIDEIPPLPATKRIPLRQHVKPAGADTGYRVTVVVPIRNGRMMHQFYVEHSPSTEHPENTYYGPFKLPSAP